MEDFRRAATTVTDADSAAPVGPGRRTLTMGLAARPTVQRKAADGPPPTATAPARSARQVQRAIDAALRPDLASADVHEIAAQGVGGPGQALPHLDAVQRSFGRHDVSAVRAHVGGAATGAAAALGATAFATGADVGFAASLDLFTAAHEAAHVVQQRAGVALRGGVDDGAGDPYEIHADAVAAAVVRGESAEALLDQHAGTGTGGAGVQRQIDLVGLNSKPKAQVADVEQLLRAADAAYKTNHAKALADDPALQAALADRVASATVHRYGFLQADELMAGLREDVRRSILHGGKLYGVDATLREAADNVYKVSRDGQTSVIKRAGVGREDEMRNEADAMERVRGHQNVVSLIERAPNNKQIRMEFVSQGMLRDLAVDTEAKAKGLARGIIDGLAHCHAHNVVHGDLDNKNVFIGGTAQAPVAKIADFGSSKQGAAAVRESAAGDVCGGATMLKALAAPYQDSPTAVAFGQAVVAVDNQAKDINSRAMQAAMADPATQAAVLGMPLEEYLAMVGGAAAPPAPSADEVARLVQAWRALAELAWVA